jgi:hypothetical protein
MMRTTMQNSILTRVMLIMLALIILIQPMLVASSPTIPDRSPATDTLTASAERYITSLSDVVRLSTALIGPIEAVRTTPPSQLPEAFVTQTRQQALDLAVQSAIAIGAVDAFTADIAKLGGTLPPAIDIAQTVAAGLPLETKQDFQQVIGLSTTQITGIEQKLQELATTRFAIAQTGLPQETQNQLLQAGFSQTDIGRITTTLASQGLTRPAIATRLDQFRATKWELSTLRMRALILATQMMARSIDARQAHRVVTQPASQINLTELANDELRLLTHIAALRSEWGTDPRLDRGEGQWWFIERYAQRAGERLEQLMLTTQNPAFAVDLLFIDQMRTLAITARSGDPASVTSELEHLNDLLAFQLGDPVVDSRQVVGSTSAGVSTSAQLSDIDLRVDAAIPIDTAARARIVLITNNRLLQAQVSGGTISEANEDNNSYAFIFPYVANTQVQLAPEVTAALEENFGHVDPAREKQIAWFWGVVTGQSDDWTALIGNFVFSVIPVLGIIPDLATLALDEGWFVKALAVIGIISSLGDLLALVPGLQAAGGGSAVADGLAAGFKIAYKELTSSGAKAVLKNLASFDVAFTIAKGLIEAAGKLFVKELKQLINSPKDFLNFVKTIWRNFDALVKLLREQGLREVGVTMGGLLLGGLIDRGKQIAEQLYKTVIRLFDRIAETSLAKSDEALVGLAKIAEDVGEPGAWRVLERLGCLAQAATAQAPARPGVLAWLEAPVAHAEEGDPCALATTFLKVVYEGSEVKWADEGLEGLEAILRRGPDAEAYAKGIVSALKDDYTDDVIQQTFALLGKQPTAWSNEAVDGVARVIASYDRIGAEALENLLEDANNSAAFANIAAMRNNVFTAFFRDVTVGDAATILNRYTDPEDMRRLGALIISGDGLTPQKLASQIVAMDQSKMLDLLRKFTMNADIGSLRTGFSAYREGITNIVGNYGELKFFYVPPPITDPNFNHEINAIKTVSGDFKLLGAGDNGVRRVLGLSGKAPDYLAVSRDGTFLIGDAKNVSRIDDLLIDDMKGKTAPVIDKLKDIGNFEPIEIVAKERTDPAALADFLNGYHIEHGLLFDGTNEVLINNLPVVIRFIP